MTQSMEELIERLREAKGADRRLDAAIHAVVTPQDFENEDEAGHYATYPEVNRADLRYFNEFIPRYTASIDAALALVERKLPGWAWFVQKIEGVPSREPLKDCLADLWLPAVKAPSLRGERVTEDASTPPLAIILALLTALNSKASP